MYMDINRYIEKRKGREGRTWSPTILKGVMDCCFLEKSKMATSSAPAWLGANGHVLGRPVPHRKEIDQRSVHLCVRACVCVCVVCVVCGTGVIGDFGDKASQLLDVEVVSREQQRGVGLHLPQHLLVEQAAMGSHY
jgi:hypothetical protein